MPKTEADFPLDSAAAFELLRLATIYHEQANACRKEGARLASCVMLVATVEAMLIAVINLFSDEVRPVAIEKKLNLEELLRWDFGKLLDVAKAAKLLPEKLNLHPKMDPRPVKDPVPTDKSERSGTWSTLADTCENAVVKRSHRKNLILCMPPATRPMIIWERRSTPNTQILQQSGRLYSPDIVPITGLHIKAL
jgi:hypothetical protein